MAAATRVDVGASCSSHCGAPRPRGLLRGRPAPPGLLTGVARADRLALRATPARDQVPKSSPELILRPVRIPRDGRDPGRRGDGAKRRKKSVQGELGPKLAKHLIDACGDEKPSASASEKVESAMLAFMAER